MRNEKEIKPRIPLRNELTTYEVLKEVDDLLAHVPTWNRYCTHDEYQKTTNFGKNNFDWQKPKRKRSW